MNPPHRRTFLNVFVTCGVSVGLFRFVLMLVNALTNFRPLVLAGQRAPETFVRWLVLLVPLVISYALPKGMLTGILVVLGRMSSDREITALCASGPGLVGRFDNHPALRPDLLRWLPNIAFQSLGRWMLYALTGHEEQRRN